MQQPVEISYRGVEKLDYIDNYIMRRVARLDKLCDYLIHAHIAVEKYQEGQVTGNPYRVRVYLTLPRNGQVVVDRLSAMRPRQEPLITTIRKAFEATERQLKAFMERQRGEVKKHPSGEVTAVVNKLFPEEGYGFLRTSDGRDIYFHKNAVPHDHFDRLRIGSGVRYVESMGEKGPQASTVEPVDPRGTHATANVPTGAEPY